jgi:hypothetical protein
MASSRRALTCIDAAIGFSAEVRTGAAHFYVADGQLLVSREARWAAPNHHLDRCVPLAPALLSTVSSAGGKQGGCQSGRHT